MTGLVETFKKNPRHHGRFRAPVLFRHLSRFVNLKAQISGSNFPAKFPYKMSSEEIIRNIIRDIVSRSSTVIKTRRTTAVVSEKKVHTWQVTETLAAFMVRSIVLDPRCGFNVNEEMDRGAVERLIQVR